MKPRKFRVDAPKLLTDHLGDIGQCVSGRFESRLDYLKGFVGLRLACCQTFSMEIFHLLEALVKALTCDFLLRHYVVVTLPPSAELFPFSVRPILHDAGSVIVRMN